MTVEQINDTPVYVHQFRLSDSQYGKGITTVRGKPVGDLSRVEKPEHGYENRELPGWACSLRLIWIGMRMQGSDITFEQVVGKARTLGIYRDGIALYGNKYGRIGDNGIPDYLKVGLCKELGCLTTETKINDFSALNDLVRQGFLVIVSTVTPDYDQLSDESQTMDTHDILLFSAQRETGLVSIINTDHRNPNEDKGKNGTYGVMTMTYETLSRIAYDVDGPRNTSETIYLPGGMWSHFKVVTFKV